MSDTTQGQDAPQPVQGGIFGGMAYQPLGWGDPTGSRPAQTDGAGALAPQSPFAPPPQPPTPTAGPPPQGHLNAPPTPQQPQLQQNKEPPPDAQEYRKSAMGWASAFAVLGAIAGRFTRAPGGAALGAFGEAVKGWQTGNLQAYQTAADKWERESKQALDNNKLVLEKYKLTLENYKLNIDQQMQQIQLDAANYHDKQMYDATRAGNYTLATQLYEKGWRFTDQGYQYHAELSEKGQEIKQKAEQTGAYWLSPEGQARLPTLSPAQQGGVKQLIDVFKIKAVKGGQSGQLVAQENQERADRGEAPMSVDEELGFIQKVSGATAYGRTAGSQGARVENAVNEVEQLIPQAVDTSKAYLRGKVVSFNKVKNAINSGVSDETFNDFELANFSLINAYTRAMNPQGVPRVTERLEQHALGILSTAISPQAYNTQIRRLWKEVQASKTATAKTAEGRSPGDINAPVPGLDNAPEGGDSGWGKAEVVK